MLFHHRDLTVFRATRRRLIIFSEGWQYDGQSPDRGRKSFAGQDCRNFFPDRDRRNFSPESGRRDFSPNRGRRDFLPRGRRELSPEQARSHFPSSRAQGYGRHLSSDYNSRWNFSPDTLRDNRFSSNQFQSSAGCERVEFALDSRQGKSQRGFFLPKRVAVQVARGIFRGKFCRAICALVSCWSK